MSQSFAVAPEPGTKPFDVSREPATVVQDADYEEMNVCRVTALNLLWDDTGRAGLQEELNELGFSDSMVRDGIAGRMDFPAVFSAFRANRSRGTIGENRIALWSIMNDDRSPRDTGIFLLFVLSSELELESTAAAAVLWQELRRYLSASDDLGSRERWRIFLADRQLGLAADTGHIEPPAEPWSDVFERALAGSDDVMVLVGLLQERLLTSMNSPDPVARDLAHAPFMSAEPPDDPVELEHVSTGWIPDTAELASTIVHGTWAWYASWWRPGKDSFFEYATTNLHRPHLYGGGARFSWSGAYRKAHRRLAGQDLRDWIGAIAPGGLQTVFAHSYGGEVAARAILDGADIQQLVLLSVPVSVLVEQGAHQLIQRGGQVWDIRLRKDSVLDLDGEPQRFRHQGSVHTVLLSRWRLSHGATHTPRVWERDGALERLRGNWR